MSKSWLRCHQQLEHTSHWAMPLVKESGTIVPIAQTDRQTRNRGWQIATAIFYWAMRRRWEPLGWAGEVDCLFPAPVPTPDCFLLQQLQPWGMEERRDIQLSLPDTTQPAEPCCIQPHRSDPTPRTAWTTFNTSNPYQFGEEKLQLFLVNCWLKVFDLQSYSAVAEMCVTWKARVTMPWGSLIQF